MNASLQVKLIRLGHLLPLSLVNATKHVPQPLTNEDRVRLMRPLLPVEKYNSRDWSTTSPKSPSSAIDLPASASGGANR
jgi:hypothetical protein